MADLAYTEHRRREQREVREVLRAQQGLCYLSTIQRCDSEARCSMKPLTSSGRFLTRRRIEVIRRVEPR
jgi:hypothetical protein